MLDDLLKSNLDSIEVETDKPLLCHFELKRLMLHYIAKSICSVKLSECGLQINSTTERRDLHGWVSMVELLHPSHTSPRAMQSIRCSGVKQPPLDSRAVEERSLE